MATRRERVILELQDDFTAGMAKAAAATALLNKQLDGLNNESLLVKQALRDAAKESDEFTKSTRKGAPDIDRFSGRLTLMAKAASILGPALVPLSAAAVGGVAALATQFGVVAAAGGVMVTALVGVGDGLEALNKAQLEPTAENLEALEVAMGNLGPAGAQFVTFLDSLGPSLKQLQFTAREGLLPGLEDGIESLMTLAPQVNSIIADLSTTLGDLFRDAGAGLAGPKFEAFFDYLDTQAGPILRQFGESIGNLTEGLANMLVGFAPVTDDFSAGLLGMTERFAEWSRTLGDNQGFQDFVAYVRESGPQVLDLLGSLTSMLVSFASAVAPIGSAVLPILTGVADAFAAIASNPVGATLITAAAGFTALNSAVGGLAVGAGKLGASQAAVAGFTSTFAKGGPQVVSMLAGIGAIDAGFQKLTDARLGDDVRTSILRLADGEVTGGLDKLGQYLSDTADNMVGVRNDLEEVITLGFGDTELDIANDELGKIDATLAQLVRDGNAPAAAAAFREIEKVAAEAGLSAAETAERFPELTEALGGMSPAAFAAQQASAQLAASQAEVAAAAEAEADAIRESVAAMYAKRDAALAAFDAETQYRQALKAATEQAAKNEAGIKGSSEAALANRGALSQLAAAWNNQSDAVKNNTARFREARSSFIETAVAMGVPREAAERLARKILDIPEKRVTRVNLEGGEAAARSAAAVAAALDSIDRNVAVRITTTMTTIKNSVGNLNPFSGAGGDADGGLIRGPGGPRDDLVPRWLSNGEYVVQAAAVKKYGVGFMDAINASKMATGGLAATGAPGGLAYRTSAMGADTETARFARAVRESEQGLRAEMRVRVRLLEKAVEAATKERDAQRERLQFLKDERKALAADVAGRFNGSPFSGGADIMRDVPSELYEAARQFAISKSGQQQNTVDQRDLDAYLASLSAGDRGAALASIREGQLQSQTRDATSLGVSLATLRAQGLPDSVIAEIARNASVDEARFYASNAGAAASLASLFAQRDAAAQSAGGRAGGSLNDDIRAQADVTREAVSELRELKQQQARAERRLAAIEKNTTNAPERTGAAVASAVNGAATTGRGKNK